ncbi:MAG TPA: serine/threonine-protein kinase [Verrucomicrobiae bacterium]|nr:serine/threonine-protein kinase [Verrucomicrobiae bacterium]
MSRLPDADRWRTLAPLLREALALEPGDRAGFLDRACASDPRLREDIEALLRADQEAAGLSFLGAPADVPPPEDDNDEARSVLDAPGGSGSPRAGGSAAGRAIGPYRLVREIGRGGMGVVYEAEQQSPRRPVALKVILGGRHVDPVAVRMFQRESESLARLRHPSIAAIYESGATVDGEHFFAMELVQGTTLSQHLEAEGPPRTREALRRRLALFRKIAAAVAYAHQRGVIHRDLKPSNILVLPEKLTSAPHPSGSGPYDEAPDVKVLDFGLARITGEDAEATALTAFGRVQGTLPFMSPEQVRGRRDEIDVRTDVYSLGVLLHRMVSGQPPYDLDGADLPEAARIICEQPPRPLRPAPGARFRFDHDLAVISRKALEKEPVRRYQTVAALDEDLGRYLAGQPIQARPPSTAYQLRLLVRRHTAPFVAAGLVLLLVVAFALFAAFQARRIAAERDRARREAATASQVSLFLQRLFDQSHPNNAMGRDLTARQMLDLGTERIDRELADQPDVQATLMQTMGSSYLGLGLYAQAAPLLERAVALRSRIYGAEARETLAAMNDLAMNLHLQGRAAEAEVMYRRTYEGRRKTDGDDDPDTLIPLEGLAWVYAAQGRVQEQEAALRRILEGRERTLGPEDRGTLMARSELGAVLSNTGRSSDAEPLLRQALDGQKRVMGVDHPNTLGTMLELADLEEHSGRMREAEALFLDMLERMKRVLGPDHPMTLSARNDYATLLDQLHRWPEAQAILEDNLARRRRVLGDDHTDTLSSLDNLANIYSVQHLYARAEPLQKEALERDRRLLGDHHPLTLSLLYNLGCTAALRGDRNTALDWLTQAVDNGWTRGNQMADDEDLTTLRGDPRFRALVERANAAAPAASGGHS